MMLGESVFVTYQTQGGGLSLIPVSLPKELATLNKVTFKSVSSDIQTLRSSFSTHIREKKRIKFTEFYDNSCRITLFFLLCKCYFRELLKWYLRHIESYKAIYFKSVL